MKMDFNLYLNKLLSLNNYMNFNLWFINLLTYLLDYILL